MKEVRKTFDFNAHIGNLEGPVQVVNGQPQVSVSFTNLNYGTITGLKLRARAFNSFDEPIQFGGGRESFQILLQDLNVPPQTPYVGRPINLPHPDIRKLVLGEEAVSLSDGQILPYQGPFLQEAAVPVLDPVNPADLELLNYLRIQHPKAHNLPLDLGDDWLCSCSQLNPKAMDQCMACGSTRDRQMFHYSEPQLTQGLEKMRQDQVRKANEQAEAERLASAKAKKRNLLIAATVVAFLMGAYFFNHFQEMKGRQTFTTVEEMKTYLEGFWSYKTEYGSVVSIEFTSDDKAKWSLGVGVPIDYNVTYNPKQGEVKRGATELVLKDNRLIEGKNEYTRGKLASYELTSPTSKDSAYESAYTALSIYGFVTHNTVFKQYQGTIKNNGSKTYSFVEVKASFQSLTGDVLDTDWTYAVGSEGLAPGETKTFTMSVPLNKRIDKASVSILDYN